MIKYFKGKNKINLFLLIMFFIIFFVSAYFERNKMIGLYNSGIDKIDNEEYQEAQEILGELGDYKDSLNQIEIAKNLEQQKTIYNSAIELFNSEDYKIAINLFEQIRDFKDSEDYIKKATELQEQKEANDVLYSEAYKYYKSKDYILAIQTFSKLNDYKDSEDMIQECRLELARLQHATTISAGIRSSVGMIRNGEVYLAGDDEYSWEDELETWNDIISISVKGNFVVGLKNNGTVITAGEIPNFYVSTNSWNNIIAISAGEQYIIGLKDDGTLVAQGHNKDGQANIDDWKNIVAISTGWKHTVGLDSNGKIHITGYNSDSQLKQIENAQSSEKEWTDIIAISAGGGSENWGKVREYGHTVGLKKDHTVVAVGDNSHGQCEVSDREKWSDIIAISAGDFHTVGLKSNGTVVTTQIGDSADEISKWTDIVAVSAGYGFTLGLKSDGSVVGAGYYRQGQIDVDSWEDITNYREEWQSIFDQNLRWNGIK